MRYLLIALLLALTGCVGVPDGINPIKNLDSQRYLGNWYEIARLDHSFERGLEQVTANYSMRQDGGIKVINRGFDTVSKQWQEAEGKAYFVGDNNFGHLKVSFFGPFYGSYIIFDLDKEYQYSLVTGSNRSYLWLLSRTPQLDNKLKNKLISQLTQLGFQTEDLIFVKQLNKANVYDKSGD